LLLQDVPGSTKFQTTTFELKSLEPQETKKFRLHEAFVINKDPSDFSCLAILTTQHKIISSGESVKGARSSQTKYYIYGIQLFQSSQSLKVIWKLEANDFPEFAFVDELSTICIGTRGQLEVFETKEPPLKEAESSNIEFVPIPRADPPSHQTYYWNQSPTSITLNIPLPQSIPTKSIKCDISRTSISLSIQEAENFEGVPTWSDRKFYDTIDSSESIWTLSRPTSKTSKTSLLMIEIEKNPTSPNHWPHVFNEDDNVPETMDPSEVLTIAERIDGWRQVNQGAPALGSSSLLGNDEDEESVGEIRQVGLSFLSPDHDWKPITCQGNEEVTLLSTSLPGCGFKPTGSLITKSTIDGLLFYPSNPLLTSPQPSLWKHTSTFPALSYVLASKPQSRFSYHSPPTEFEDEVFMLIEQPSAQGYSDIQKSTNIYLYFQAKFSKDRNKKSERGKYARQKIVRVECHLVGVCGFLDQEGKLGLVGLADKELYIINKVLD
jgi:hypothetical protein